MKQRTVCNKIDTVKKKLITVSIFLLSLSVCFAITGIESSVEVDADCVFTHPTAEYLTFSQGKELPGIRTSLGFNADIQPLCISFGKFRIGAGVSACYNTKSLAAGVHLLREYFALGPLLDVKYSFTRRFSADIKVRYFFCAFLPHKQRFEAFEAGIVPSLCIYDKKPVSVDISLPLNVSVKADTVSFKTGVGCIVRFDWNMEEY